MLHSRAVRFLLTVMTCAACVLSLSSAATAASTATAAHSVKTHVVTVRPVTAATLLQRGYTVTKTLTGATCSPGSEAIGRAYRCFAVHGVYDPCWVWSDPHPVALDEVLCLPNPWSHQAVALTVPDGLPATTGSRTPDKHLPWGIQLANGQKCVLAQGAHSQFNGRVIDYGCGTTSVLVVLRGLDERHPLWRARTARWAKDHWVAAGVTTITTAWLGLSTRY